MDSLGGMKVKAMTKRIAALGLILAGMAAAGQAWAGAAPPEHPNASQTMQTKPLTAQPRAQDAAARAVPKTRNGERLAWDRVGSPIRPTGLGVV
jgi:hypothetical protein